MHAINALTADLRNAGYRWTFSGGTTIHVWHRGRIVVSGRIPHIRDWLAMERGLS